MDGITRPMLDCLDTTAWGMKHFGGIVTNKQLPLAVMRQCVKAGLCKSIGMVALCDADGFTIQPERYRTGYVLTEKGEAVLEAYHASLREQSCT